MANCNICGEPMPAGEEMFMYHGYSGPCPKPPLRERVGAPIPTMDRKTINFLGFAAWCSYHAGTNSDMGEAELLRLWEASSESVRVKWRLIADTVLTVAHLRETFLNAGPQP